MKYKRRIIMLSVVSILAITAAACGSNDDVGDTLEDLPTPTGEYVNPFLEVDRVFELTEHQKQLYDEFIENLDIEIFKDVDPVDIAHVYIECGINGSWEAEYTLYAQEELGITKQEAQKRNRDDMLRSDIRSRRDYANILFAYLQEGEFVEDGDNKGHIAFQTAQLGFEGDYTSDEKDDASMQFIKENGIWLVRWLPFDESL